MDTEALTEVIRHHNGEKVQVILTSGVSLSGEMQATEEYLTLARGEQVCIIPLWSIGAFAFRTSLIDEGDSFS